MSKVCNTCQKEQSLDQFHVRGRTVINCQTCRVAGIAVQNGSKKRSREFTQKYGISLSDYDKMLAAQNGVCFICLKDDPKGRWKNNPRGFCVDHDHSTGVVRGLLCNTCNQGLGNFYDSSKFLRRAADYIDYHDQRPNPS